MRKKYQIGLAGLALLLPAALWLTHHPAWAWGWLTGEALGAISLAWVTFTVQRYLVITPQSGPRVLWWHAAARYLLIAAVLLIVIRTQFTSLWAVLAGYFLIQLPGVMLRALPN